MIQDALKVSAAVTLSGSSAGVSFYADTLPMIQWYAALIAITSGLVGMMWVAIQIRAWFKSRRRS